MQWLSNHTKSLQDQFAEYCRTGQTVALPGTSAERMKHYRRLSFNVISNALEQAYPITLEVLTDDDWITLVDGFYANHKSSTPLLWQMPYEFYEYVENNDLPVKKSFHSFLSCYISSGSR
ncbi:MAG: DNA-binding domain-containing protein [Bacteroidales bacterium]|nr:DNA-binding domain-containing protein [Bacteroidales bacterium]